LAILGMFLKRSYVFIIIDNTATKALQNAFNVGLN